jgi:glycine hydroxymethyltransferase
VQVAEFFDRSVTFAQKLKQSTGTKLKDFKAALEKGVTGHEELEKLKGEVTEFSRKFPTVGF